MKKLKGKILIELKWINGIENERKVNWTNL